MMTGLAFAVVYCTMGIPVARIADSTSRKGVMVVSLAIWSAFTALCGLANPIHIGTFTISAFVVLLITRMGVGLGEAGGSPPAHAMISDLYEKEKRGRALALYSAGLYAGTLLGYYLGGWLSEALNWRQAFFVVGIPGVIFAIIAWTTVREPVRGLSGATASDRQADLPQIVREALVAEGLPLLRHRHRRGHLHHLRPRQLDAVLHAAHLRRRRSGSVGRDGQIYRPVGHARTAERCSACARPQSSTASASSRGLLRDEQDRDRPVLRHLLGVGGMIGTIAGGYLADRLGAKDRRWFLWVPMWGKILGAPLFIAAMLAPNVELSLLLYFPGITLAAMYLGPALAITHHLVPASMRAMSSAVLFFILNILGLGTGPFVVGIVSDWISGNADRLSQAHSFLGDSVEQVKQMSLKWAMIIAVILMTPLAILWHIGAMKLPKGELDDEGDAVKEALTEGDPKGHTQTTGPSA